MGGGESTDTVKNVLCGSQDLVQLPLSTNAPARTPDTLPPQPPHVANNITFCEDICLRPGSFTPKSTHSDIYR